MCPILKGGDDLPYLVAAENQILLSQVLCILERSPLWGLLLSIQIMGLIPHPTVVYMSNITLIKAMLTFGLKQY